MNHSPQYLDYPNHVSQLIAAELATSDPAAAVERHLQRNGRILMIGSQQYDLEQGQLFVIAVGKAAVPMSMAAISILSDWVTSAVLVAKKTARDWRAEIEESSPDAPVELFLAGHPIPNEESLLAGTAVLNLLAQTTENDLVLFLISGGASALLASPLLPLADWQQLTDALLASGCTINELNCVRRQLDRVKGGGLAKEAAPASCASLILSDVIGNSLADIGSGPTVFINETPQTALSILEQYHIAAKLGTDAWQRLIAALEKEIETPTALPAHNQHLIIGDVAQAAAAVLTKAAQLGFISEILTTHLEGEAREIGKVAAALAKDAPAGRCLILGGETTVTLRGQGIGGRNQELALAAAIALEGEPRRVVICLATDGEDGPTDAAGAVVTGDTAVTAYSRNIDPRTYQTNNDSYHFFKLLDNPELDESSGGDDQPNVMSKPISQHHIKTGSTGTNVNDLLIILTYDK